MSKNYPIIQRIGLAVPLAADITLDVGNFSYNLSASDTDVQTAMDTIDNLPIFFTDATRGITAGVTITGSANEHQLEIISNSSQVTDPFIIKNSALSNVASFGDDGTLYQAGEPALKTSPAQTSGVDNVFMGTDAGKSNLADNNIFIGGGAGETNSTGTGNVIVGKSAFAINSIGDSNVALGTQSLENNTTGDNNFGFGFQALKTNNTGSNNIAIGALCMKSMSNNSNNIAIGLSALKNATGVSSNVFIGNFAGESYVGGANVVQGYEAAQAGAGDFSVMIGYRSGYYVVVIIVSFWGENRGEQKLLMEDCI